MKKIFITMLILAMATVAQAADIKLDWDAVSGAVGYKISMSTDLGATWQTPVDVKLVKPFTYPNVPEDKLVLFKVCAYNSAGTESWNQWAFAACDYRKKPLEAPTGAGIK